MIVIHGRANSSNVQKVLWLFDEIGLPFERVDRGGKFGGLDDPDYLALNPNGLVPTVIDGDLVLWESQAILRHYARQNPGAALFPGNPADAARSDMVMDWNIRSEERRGGKSVSVRVDLGGRRIIKKTKHTSFKFIHDF